jgi:hypothetical protein
VLAINLTVQMENANNARITTTASATEYAGESRAITSWKKDNDTTGRNKKLKTIRTTFPTVNGMFFERRSSSGIFASS